MGNGRRNSLRADTLPDCNRWSLSQTRTDKDDTSATLSERFGESREGFPASRKARLSRGSDYDYGRRRTTVPSARTARTPRQLVFSCCLIFVRTNAAFSASVLRPVARWVPLVSERELPPLALLAWAARLQVLFAAVSPLALCVSPSFPSSVFPQRYLRPPTR